MDPNGCEYFITGAPMVVPACVLSNEMLPNLPKHNNEAHQ